MGFQIANTCYPNREQAENAYFSQVVPRIGQDGELVQVQYSKGRGWTLDGQIVQAYLPECNPAENLKDGMIVGWLVFGIMAAAWSVKFVAQRIR